MALIDPDVVGTPIEEILGSPLSQHGDLCLTRTLNSWEVGLLHRHRLVALVRDTWLDEEQRVWLHERQRIIATMQMVVERELTEVLGVLGPLAADVRLLKGLATGALDYPNPGLRQTADVDLLVKPTVFDEVLSTLTSSGYRLHELSNRVDPDLVKGITLVSDSNVEVDLHSRLNRYAKSYSDALLDDPCPLPNGALALPSPIRLIHAAGHLIWSPPGERRLSGLVDISAILDTTAVDLRQVAELANSLGIGGLVATALDVEAQVRGRALDQDTTFEELTGAERRAFIRSHRSLVAEHVLALQQTSGLRRRAQYIHQFLFPEWSVVARRGGFGAHYGRVIPRKRGPV